jgi:hypothetical protein
MMLAGANADEVTTRTHLFIEANFIKSNSGAQIALGPVTKEKTNPLFGEFGSKGGKPWELAWWNTYPTVAYDTADKMYKMWYNGFVGCKSSRKGFCPNKNYPIPNPSNGTLSATFYAESTDAITWSKPDLGIVKWNGSSANNIAFTSGSTDPNRGIFLDLHEADPSKKFKAFGALPKFVGVMTSPDGKTWNVSAASSATSMAVAADTANNALYDSDLKEYIAFSRNHCHSSACNESGWGDRREVRSTAKDGAFTANQWTKAIEVLHGEHGYEMYSLVPWRSPKWAAGVYLGIGSYYATGGSTIPGVVQGSVYCELHSSADYGVTWTRVAPHKSIIPLGKAGTFDSRTCYAAPPIIDPTSADRTLLYYAGGDGPHSGPLRSDYMALARASTDALAGYAPIGKASATATLTTRPVQWASSMTAAGAESSSSSSSGSSVLLTVGSFESDKSSDKSSDDASISVELLSAKGGVLAIGTVLASDSAEWPHGDSGVSTLEVKLAGADGAEVLPSGMVSIRLKFSGISVYALELK